MGAIPSAQSRSHGGRGDSPEKGRGGHGGRKTEVEKNMRGLLGRLGRFQSSVFVQAYVVSCSCPSQNEFPLTCEDR